MMSSTSMERLTPGVGSIFGLDEEGSNGNELVHRKPPIIEAILNELGFGWFQVQMIVILGVAHSTDTMETIIQAILGPSLRCFWRLSADYVALLTSLVFLGSCIGAVPLGYAADVYGRRSICLFSCLVLMYLSWLCAISPTYAWMASLRFLSGLFIGGVLTSGSSLLSETMPSKFQASGQLITNNFEALIGVITAAIGLGCLEGRLNWRFFVFFTTFPLALCAIALAFFTLESPVYLYCKKQTVEAANVLDKVAITNRRIPKNSTSALSFLGRIREADEAEDFRISKVGVKELYTLLIRRRPWLLLLLLCLNFSWGFLIYGGTTILPVELAAGPRMCIQNLQITNTTSLLPAYQPSEGSPFECCKPLREEGYQSLLISASGGLVSLPLAYGLAALLRQRLPIAQFVTFLFTGILLFVQTFCMTPTASNVVFFVTRGVAAAGSGLMGIYASNIFQARVRSLATGLCAAAYRLGILTAPYVGQILLQDRSDLLAILTFALVAVGSAIGSIVLPRMRALYTAPSFSSSTSDSSDLRRCLPFFWGLFGASKVPDQVGSLSKVHRRSGVTAFSPITLPTDPDVALVETTYRALRQRDKDAQNRGGPVVREDFVQRNAAFEVDA
ncbi:synaptic vesicle 2 protein [Echinococcus multilocularis]|uniref:Synaptic vesicle 2 protein n=1 Tax=Echinococcus multilocularis TaxID=6211 RepID=A0A068Y5A8_ECHMU|nr:synaptic vesicle 2 protein [Echinococcus multilocularis]